MEVAFFPFALPFAAAKLASELLALITSKFRSKEWPESAIFFLWVWLESPKIARNHHKIRTALNSHLPLKLNQRSIIYEQRERVKATFLGFFLLDFRCELLEVLFDLIIFIENFLTGSVTEIQLAIKDCWWWKKLSTSSPFGVQMTIQVKSF